MNKDARIPPMLFCLGMAVIWLAAWTFTKSDTTLVIANVYYAATLIAGSIKGK